MGYSLVKGLKMSLMSDDDSDSIVPRRRGQAFMRNAQTKSRKVGSLLWLRVDQMIQFAFHIICTSSTRTVPITCYCLGYEELHP